MISTGRHSALSLRTENVIGSKIRAQITWKKNDLNQGPVFMFFNKEEPGFGKVNRLEKKL